MLINSTLLSNGVLKQLREIKKADRVQSIDFKTEGAGGLGW